MSRNMPFEKTRVGVRWLGLSLLPIGISILGCTIDEFGTIPTEPNKPGSTSSGDVSSSGSGNSSSIASSTSSGGGQGGAGQGGQGGMGGAGGQGGGVSAVPPRTCLEILKGNPNAPSDTYTVDPDGNGPQAPFPVVCKMNAPRAWTLVALEKPNNVRNLFLLGVERGTPDDLVAGENAIIGVRFKGLYSIVRIEWDSSSYITFDLDGTEIFDDTVKYDIPIKNVSTSESTLAGWLMSGAKFCRATSESENNYPGDSSWAVKPLSDNFTECGCNGFPWAGQGAFYGGSGDLKTYCGAHYGGFAGVKDDGQAKSVYVPWYTRIYVQ